MARKATVRLHLANNWDLGGVQVPVALRSTGQSLQDVKTKYLFSSSTITKLGHHNKLSRPVSSVECNPSPGRKQLFL